MARAQTPEAVSLTDTVIGEALYQEAVLEAESP